MNEAVRLAIARQQEIHDLAEAENRDLSEAETREYNNLQLIIDAANDEGQATGNDNRRDTAPNENRGDGEQNGDNSESPQQQEERQQNNYSTTETTEISNMCRHFGLDPGKYFSRGLTVQQVRREIIQHQMNNQPPIGVRVEVTDDERDKRRRAMTDGIVLRSGGSITNPAPGSNKYRNMSIREIAVECMEYSNPETDYRHMDTERILSAITRDFYNPESDFPAILDDVIQKSYVEGLNKARVTFDKWVKFGSLTNFKKTTNHEYIMSLGGRLERVPENGELKAYVPQDAKMPDRQLDTYGRQFTMSRKAFIDDDIGLITTMPRRYAEMSQRTLNDAVYDILLNNNKIYDGKLLFSSERKNTLKDGTGVTLKAIQQMIYKIGIQKDIAGNQLALVPDLFIVPFGLGVEVQKILGSPTINTPDNTQSVNPYYGGNFEVVEDVTINGMVKEGEALPWFMGVKHEIIQVDYLNGQREATIRRSEKPGTLGLVWDVYFDFGVSMLHPEAICRNPGAVLSLDD